MIRWFLELIGIEFIEDSGISVFHEYCRKHNFEKTAWGSTGKGMKFRDCPCCLEENSREDNTQIGY